MFRGILKREAECSQLPPIPFLLLYMENGYLRRAGSGAALCLSLVSAGRTDGHGALEEVWALNSDTWSPTDYRVTLGIVK